MATIPSGIPIKLPEAPNVYDKGDNDRTRRMIEQALGQFSGGVSRLTEFVIARNAIPIVPFTNEINFSTEFGVVNAGAGQADISFAAAQPNTHTWAAVQIFGIDPGGTEIVRIGGQVRASQIGLGGAAQANQQATFYASGGAGVQFKDTAGSPLATWDFGQGAGDGLDGLAFYNRTATAVRFRVRAGGQVDIPTGPLIVGTDPGSAEKLRVSGSINLALADYISFGGIANGYFQLDGTPRFLWSIGGTLRMQLTTGALNPQTSAGLTLGTVSLPWGASWFNGTLTQTGGPIVFANGAATSIGTSDNFGFSFKTNALVRWSIDTNGDFVGDTTNGGRLKFGPAVSKIIPGGTSLSLRNNADNADNILVTDAGNITTRGTLRVVGQATFGTGAAGSTAAIGSGGAIITSESFQVQRRDTAATVWLVYSQSGTFSIWDAATGATDRFSIKTGGEVDVLTGPLVVGIDPGGAELLRIGGATRLNGTLTQIGGPIVFANGAATSIGTSDAFGFSFKTNALVRWSIDTSGNLIGDTTNGGYIKFGTAVSKIIPGGTSISLRNNADSADNLLMSDAGLATLRTKVHIGLNSTQGGEASIFGLSVTKDVQNGAGGAGGFAFAGEMVGIDSTTDVGGAQHLAGAQLAAVVTAAGNYHELWGAHIYSLVSLGGTCDLAIGTYSQMSQTSGTLLCGVGAEVEVLRSAGAMTTAIGLAVGYHSTHVAQGFDNVATNQYGIRVGPIKNATLNYAWYSEDGWMQIGDSVAIGTAIVPVSNARLFVSGPVAATGAFAQGVIVSPTVGSGTTNSGFGITVSVATAAAAFTAGILAAINIGDAVKGASSTITAQYGIKIANQTQGATNYAIFTGTGLVSFGDNVSASGDVVASRFFSNHATVPQFEFKSGSTRWAGLNAVAVDAIRMYDSAGTVQITFGLAAVGKLIPGATSFSIRNNADTGDNILIEDAGVITFRNQLKFTTGNNTSLGTTDAFGISIKTNALVRTSWDTSGNQLADTTNGGYIEYRAGTSSVRARANGTLFKSGGAATTSTTTATLTGGSGGGTYTLKANTLAADGDTLDIIFSGDVSATTGTFTLVVGSITIINAVALSSNGTFSERVVITRVDATHIRWSFSGLHFNAANVTDLGRSAGSVALTLTSDQTINFQGSAASGTLTAYTMLIEHKAAT